MTNTRHSTRRALVGYFGTEHTGPVTELVRHLAPHVEMVGFHYEKASNQSMALRMLTPQIDGQERHDPYDIVLFMAQFAIPHVSDIEPLARAVGRPNLLEEVKLQAQKTKCEDLDNLSLGVYAAKSLLSPAHLFISVPAYLMTPEEIRKNPAITRKELSEIISLTEDGIKYHLSKMQKKGQICRVGHDKGGHWEILGYFQ